MSHPHGFLGAERIEESQHVSNTVLERIVFVARIETGASIAAHIRRDGVKAQISEDGQLVTPGNRQLRPAMHEDDRR